MRKPDRIDFEKLLGFELIARELSAGFDLQEETMGARLGAKVGTEDTPAPQKRTIEFSKLLGFDIATDELSKGLDLQDETLSAKLGAKVGPPEITSPVRGIDFQNDTLGSRLGAKVGEPEVESDVRLKRDINHLATRSDGLPIYSFRYLWDDEVHVGVMAQDLLRNEAWAPAVVAKEGGKLLVNYARLGLRMTTLDEWQAKGMAALTR